MKNDITKQDVSDLLQISVLTILILLFLAFFAGGCQEKCEEITTSYVDYVPVMKTTLEIREELDYVEPRVISNPGRIYFKDGYIFINEIGEGIHVIDNRNPRTPIDVGFVNIPGNFDLAAKGNFLYADSYVDLVVLDISDPTEIKEHTRVLTALTGFDNMTHAFDEAAQSVVVDVEEVIREGVFLDCPDGDTFYNSSFPSGGFARDDVDVLYATTLETASAGPTAGIGGSMARFTIYDNYLYTVNSYQMQLFDITELDEPEKGAMVELPWGVETIFPYEDKLFIGAVDGMHILDNQNPAQPQYISTFQHANSCDPVVVQDNLAYVTLRSGNNCQGFTNQLDVVDVTDITNPILMRSYPMQNPHGLGIDGTCLFITEGDFGLKYFDAADFRTIDQNLVKSITTINAIDVIPLGGNLMVIGSDGFHQYEYDCDNKDMQYLSSIAITNL